MRVLGAAGADAANAMAMARGSDERSKRTEAAVGELQREVRVLSDAVGALKVRATWLVGVAGLITAATPIVQTWIEMRRAERTEAQVSIAAERAIEGQREAQDRQIRDLARQVVEEDRRADEARFRAEERRLSRLRDSTLKRVPDVVTPR